MKHEPGFDSAELHQPEPADFDAASNTLLHIASRPELIFLHSSFRTCSTWFWGKFRTFPETACYCEPFNEELLTLTPDQAATVGYNSWDSRHPPGDPYYSQYLKMIKSSGGVALFDPSISLDWFTPIGGLRGKLRASEIEYLTLLADQARREDRIPVFGETRSLGRLWALKNSFRGFHIFLHRNLWRHWLSYLYYRRRKFNYFCETTARLVSGSDDPFLASVADFYVKRARGFRRSGKDAAPQPASADERLGLLLLLPESDAFAMFMALHLYLYLHADVSADLTVDVTKLVRDAEYRCRIEKELARQTGLEISLSDVADEQGRAIAIGAAAIDWDEIRKHATVAAEALSAVADPTKSLNVATEFIDSAIEELHKSEAALAMRSDASEEIWFGRLQEARCHWGLGDDSEFLRRALELHKDRPDRAEPLFDLARFHRERGMHETAADYAEAGLALERPRDEAEFVEDFVYQSGLREELSIAAFYCNDPARRDRGFASCNWLALNRDIPEDTRKLAREHLRFYAVPASSLMPSFTTRLVGFTPPEGWHPINPSVARRGNEIVMVQRTVNYVLEGGRYRTPNGVPIATRNFLLHLNAALDVETAAEILPPSDLPSPAYTLVLGFEDARLFSWRSALWCSATLREITAEGWCQQILARLDEQPGGQYRLADWRVLLPEGPPRHEKNWMPLVEPAQAEGEGERLRFVYLCDPTRFVDQMGQVAAETTPPIAGEQFRGGTQSIEFVGGRLALIHEEVEGATYADRAYHHRLVWFDRTGALRRVSRPFYFQQHGIEFAAGLTWHPDGRRLIVSYGVRDSESWIATVEPVDVARLLEDVNRLQPSKLNAADDGTLAFGVTEAASPSSVDPDNSEMIHPHDGLIIESSIDGRKVRFFVTNLNDAIMQYHVQGRFYETEELALIARHFNGTGVFVDIGANVGNHCVYVSKFLSASKILAFEPNQAAVAILRKNLLLNECRNVNTQFLGIALGSGEGRVRGGTPDADNLGHTVYSECPFGDVCSIDGDSLILDEPIEFIKIDVEGMEFEVLSGLKQVIRRWQPNIFIEVWDWKLPEFRKWCDEEGYQVVEHFERYSGIQNYVLTPLSQPPAVQEQRCVDPRQLTPQDEPVAPLPAVANHRSAFGSARDAGRQWRILIYTQTSWAFGAVHSSLAAQLRAAGWVADVKDWSKQYYLSEFQKEVEQYDYVLTVASGGNATLAHSYGIAPEKIVIVAHDEWDLQKMIAAEGIDDFDRYAGYGVISDTLACSSIALGIKRVPFVVRYGVEFAKYRHDLSTGLSRVGYATTMERLTVSGLERKRGALAKACVEAVGLEFVPVDDLPFEAMPEFYGSVDSVVMPSLQEGAGLPPLEGAAAGRLVIGTPVGHFPRLAYEGLGILAPLEAGAFQRFTAETLIYYRDNPSAYVEKCGAIQEAAKQRDWQYTVKDWIELFDNAR